MSVLSNRKYTTHTHTTCGSRKTTAFHSQENRNKIILYKRINRRETDILCVLYEQETAITHAVIKSSRVFWRDNILWRCRDDGGGIAMQRAVLNGEQDDVGKRMLNKY